MLTDIIPAKHRRRVYAIVTLAAVVFGAWQASDGNWATFAGSVLTALTTGMATANTQAGDGGEAGCTNLVTALLVLVLALLALALLGHPVRIG